MVERRGALGLFTISSAKRPPCDASTRICVWPASCKHFFLGVRTTPFEICPRAKEARRTTPFGLHRFASKPRTKKNLLTQIAATLHHYVARGVEKVDADPFVKQSCAACSCSFERPSRRPANSATLAADAAVARKATSETVRTTYVRTYIRVAKSALQPSTYVRR